MNSWLATNHQTFRHVIRVPMNVLAIHSSWSSPISRPSSHSGPGWAGRSLSPDISIIHRWPRQPRPAKGQWPENMNEPLRPSSDNVVGSHNNHIGLSLGQNVEINGRIFSDQHLEFGRVNIIGHSLQSARGVEWHQCPWLSWWRTQTNCKLSPQSGEIRSGS